MGFRGREWIDIYILIASSSPSSNGDNKWTLSKKAEYGMS